MHIFAAILSEQRLGNHCFLICEFWIALFGVGLPLSHLVILRFFNLNFLIKTMKKSFSMGAYVAPEVEVLSTIVEGGFSVSGFSTIEYAAEDEYDTAF